MIVRENWAQARYDKKRRCRTIEREFGLHNQCSYDYAMLVLQCPFPAGEHIFTQHNASSTGIFKMKPSKTSSKTPSAAQRRARVYKEAREHGRRLSRDKERLLVSASAGAYYYACDIIGCPIPVGEPSLERSFIQDYDVDVRKTLDANSNDEIETDEI